MGLQLQSHAESKRNHFLVFIDAPNDGKMWIRLQTGNVMASKQHQFPQNVFINTYVRRIYNTIRAHLRFMITLHQSGKKSLSLS